MDKIFTILISFSSYDTTSFSNHAWPWPPPQWATTSGSSQVRLWSSNSLSSPQAISLGCPSTQVIRWWQSPGTGNLGKGQNFAAWVFDGTLVGHLKPTTAVERKKTVSTFYSNCKPVIILCVITWVFSILRIHLLLLTFLVAIGKKLQKCDIKYNTVRKNALQFTFIFFVLELSCEILSQMFNYDEWRINNLRFKFG